MTVSLDGLHPTLMRPRVEAVLADPEAQGMGLFVISAFRSVERQRQLFQAAVKKYGSVAAARKWVAPPGKSNHGPRVDGYGTAVDFGVPGLAAVSGQWPAAIEAKVNAICERHGLASPMSWEDWHFEPIKNWTPTVAPAQEDELMRDERIVVVPAEDDQGRQWTFVDEHGKVLGFDSKTSSVQLKASREGKITPLVVQHFPSDGPTWQDALAVSFAADLQGSPAPVGAKARIVIEHR